MDYISDMRSEARLRSLPAVVVKAGLQWGMRLLASPEGRLAVRRVRTADMGSHAP